MRKHSRVMIVVTLFLVLSSGSILADDSKNRDEMVRQTLTGYFEAFNRHDAASAVKYWSADAEYKAPGGHKIKGPEKLRKRLDSFFREQPEAKISLLNSPRILMVSDSRAVARGAVRLELPGKKQNDLEYTAIFTREKDRWLISRMDDEHLASFESYSKLSELSWLIGEWVDSKNDETVETKFEWEPNKSFIKGRFRISINGDSEFEGYHFIGWDPVSKSLKSWVFDSEGAMGQGTWSKDVDGWSVTMSSILADGKRASAINIFRPDGPDRLIWRSTGREVSGTPLPNTEEIVVVRKSDHKPKKDKK